MSCPRCRGNNIESCSFYVTKKLNKRYRWRCKDCKKTFIVVPHLKGITVKQHKEIILLSKRKNPYASKSDHRQKKTFSTREIAKIMKISSQTVSCHLRREAEKNKKKKYGKTKNVRSKKV